MSDSDHLRTVVDILERHGVGGNELRQFADDAYGERDAETGVRPTGKKSKKDDADDNGKSSDGLASLSRAELETEADNDGISDAADTDKYPNKDSLIAAIRAKRNG